MYYLKPLCRTCIGDNKTFRSLECMDENIKLIDKLKCVIPEIEYNDNVSTLICEDCCSALQIAYTFKKMCHISDKALQTYIEKLQKSSNSVDKVELRVPFVTIDPITTSNTNCVKLTSDINCKIDDRLQTNENLDKTIKVEQDGTILSTDINIMQVAMLNDVYREIKLELHELTTNSDLVTQTTNSFMSDSINFEGSKKIAYNKSSKNSSISHSEAGIFNNNTQISYKNDLRTNSTTNPEQTNILIANTINFDGPEEFVNKNSVPLYSVDKFEQSETTLNGETTLELNPREILPATNTNTNFIYTRQSVKNELNEMFGTSWTEFPTFLQRAEEMDNTEEESTEELSTRDILPEAINTDTNTTSIEPTKTPLKNEFTKLFGQSWTEVHSFFELTEEFENLSEIRNQNVRNELTDSNDIDMNDIFIDLTQESLSDSEIKEEFSLHLHDSDFETDYSNVLKSFSKTNESKRNYDNAEIQRKLDKRSKRNNQERTKRTVNKVRKKLKKCILCEKSFTSKKELKLHMNIHLLASPHKCSTCGYERPDRKHLNSHIPGW